MTNILERANIIIGSQKRNKMGGEGMTRRNEYDYSKLKGRIREVLGTQQEYARKIQRSNTHISNLLNNYSEFEQKDIEKSVAVLGIPKKEIFSYFFTKKVHKNETKKSA